MSKESEQSLKLRISSLEDANNKLVNALTEIYETFNRCNSENITPIVFFNIKEDIKNTINKVIAIKDEEY